MTSTTLIVYQSVQTIYNMVDHMTGHGGIQTSRQDLHLAVASRDIYLQYIRQMHIELYDWTWKTWMSSQDPYHAAASGDIRAICYLIVIFVPNFVMCTILIL